MEILVVNDDGVFEIGIKILAEALKKYGNVTVVAPNTGRSAASHSLQIRQQIHFVEVEAIDGILCYACSGTPADCVRLSTSVLKKKFDVVFSGINDGLNCGTDILYSGTVAAAKEGVIEGIPGVAISTDRGCMELAKREIDSVLEYIFKNKLYSLEYVLNVNFPTKRFDHSLGYKFCRQGIKSFKTEFIINNKGSYDECDEKITFDDNKDTDVYLGRHGYTTFVPVGIDQTNHFYLKKLKELGI
jgi:5'-nucleotidase